MSEYTLSYTGEEVDELLSAVDSNRNSWDSVSQHNDYIISYGTSGVWNWKKYNSGRAECWCAIDNNSITGTSWQNLHQKALSQSLPFTFTTIQSAIASVNAGGSNIVYGTVASVTSNKINYYHSSHNDVIGGTAYLIVIGTWK